MSLKERMELAQKKGAGQESVYQGMTEKEKVALKNKPGTEKRPSKATAMFA